MNQMTHYSYGDTVRDRVRHLFEVLLSYANEELEGTEQFHSDLKVNWQTEKQLVVRTKLRILEKLIEKDELLGKLTKEQIREAINHLKNHLKILIDNRESPRGSEDWHFTLELWSKDKAENLRRFDAEWQDKRPPKSKALHSNSVESESSSAAIGGTTTEDGLVNAPKQPESTGTIRQKFLTNTAVTGNITIGGVSQKAPSSHCVEQVIAEGVQAENIGFGSVSQESSTREVP